MNSCSRLLYPHHPRANSCSSSALIKTFSLSFHNFLFKTTENSRENWNWLASTIMHRARTWVDSLVVTRWKFSGIQELFCGDIYVWWSLELWEFVGGERVEVEFFELFEFLVTKLHRKAPVRKLFQILIRILGEETFERNSRNLKWKIPINEAENFFLFSLYAWFIAWNSLCFQKALLS